MHDNIGEDLWEIGVSMFAENDVLAIRSNAEETRSLKSDVRACILADIHASINGADIDERGHTHLDYMPSWQRHIRSHTNNLGFDNEQVMYLFIEIVKNHGVCQCTLMEPLLARLIGK